MNRLARHVLALVAIVGGGVVAAAPTALADPLDTTSATSEGTTAATGTQVPVTTVPGPVAAPVPVRSGRAPDAAPPTPTPTPTPAASGGTDPAAASSTVRTGLASDFGNGATHSAVPAPQGTNPTRPAAPVPAPSGPPTRSPASAPATPAGASASRDAAHQTPTSVPAGAPPTPPAPTSYLLAAGDNLWSVAATHLASVTGRPASSVPDAEVTPYWQRVCDLNRSRLVSGDVSLVFPGEQIELPAVGT
jgi:hypothetical protein